MKYRKAEEILPIELIDEIQKYVNGECIYVPHKYNIKIKWGEKSGYREQLDKRNKEIYTRYERGISVNKLASMYYLSPKSIYRIIAEIKK